MKKLIISLLLFSTLAAGYFEDNFLKYSTFYGSVSLNSPLKTSSKWELTDNGIQDTSEEILYDYNISFGLRKIARFK